MGEGPIFIVGNSRSGTGMMGKILNNNKEIRTFPELHFFEGLWSTKDRSRIISKLESEVLLSKLIGIEDVGYTSKYNKPQYQLQARAMVDRGMNDLEYMHDVYRYYIYRKTHDRNKKIPCKQTPRYLYYINEIIEIFPEARFINMIRDPRDILASQKRKWTIGINKVDFRERVPIVEMVRRWANYHCITTTMLWVKAIMEAEKYNKEKNVINVYYERLLEDPKQTISSVCDFLGVEYDDEMLEVERTGSSINQYTNVRGIDGSRRDRWRTNILSNEEIYICEQISKVQMEEHGYKSSSTKPKKFALLRRISTMPVKLGFSLILNVKRISGLKEAVLRRFYRSTYRSTH